MQKDLKALKAKLLDRHAALMAREQATSQDRAPVELDQTRVGRLSRMDALQSQAMSIETERRRKNEIKRIEVALALIESGDYGYCRACDEEIEPQRLKLDPATLLCLSCARKG